ncbi:hypothetical protein BDN72DRAFT_939520 [Pluteus cervinus]|uniref:Uncharacterized protein n=1 Tax=Pluteus cervinus TaxID=181527 RepID=A0ACD3BBK1_9AGAR|nr:hypothetical protein BDN72DRAFT_939520 [Pluteus cervinus]
MASTSKTPLRDRLLSNSPDPIKSAILKESGKGWNSPPANSNDPSGATTSPLRISKRDSGIKPRQASLSRRTSSSYRHMRTNNLVSKSPFKSQIPTPNPTPSTPTSRHITFPTRRVSGEKRPRPLSMHEEGETENERPFALKRERRQSKTYQGLIQKEPVTKSPFRHRSVSAEEEEPFPPAPPPTMTLTTSLPTPSRSATGKQPSPSPTRPSLVSRRLHGPRLSGGRRARRKTVTFDERCDVVEFDRDEDEDEEVFESADEDAIHSDDAELDQDPFFQASSSALGEPGPDTSTEDQSYESIELSDIATAAPSAPSLPPMYADESITGLMDDLIASNARASTPPRTSDLPTDLETEDGVPFGRTHHVERSLKHHQKSPQIGLLERPAQYPFNLSLAPRSPQGTPGTPPRRSPAHTFSTPPLGRSTHIERTKAAREREEYDVVMLPASPSPHKKPGVLFIPDEQDDPPIPKFSLGEVEYSTTHESTLDPFMEDQRAAEDTSSITAADDPSLDHANLSIGHSETSLGRLDNIHESDEQDVEETEVEGGSPDQPKTTTLHVATFTSASLPDPFTLPSPTDPLLRRSPSPLAGSLSGRPRISREEVKRRLLDRQSAEYENLRTTPHIEHAPADLEHSLEVTIADDESAYFDPEPISSSRRASSDKRLSVLTTATDISAEMATIEHAERFQVNAFPIYPPSKPAGAEFGLLSIPERLDCDFGSKFSLGGLGIGNIGGSTKSREEVAASKPPVHNTTPEEETSSIAGGSGGSIKLGDVGVDVEMRSALDRLMDHVAATKPDDSMRTEMTDMTEMTETDDDEPDELVIPPPHPKPIERAATDSALLDVGAHIQSRNVSGSSTYSLPPPLPPKDAIRTREAMIIEKRREARRLEEAESQGYLAPRKFGANLGVGRPTRRRSMSTGDADSMESGIRRRRVQLLSEIESGNGVGKVVVEDDLLGDSIERELRKLDGPNKYHVREPETLIYASSAGDGVSHMAGPGDVNAGKAWRTVRRPSDMNEYAKQIKEYRAQDKSGKAYGKVFVKVLGVKGLHLPLPDQPTSLTCTLNNGIHFVTTPECQLGSDCRIEQEFELIEHSKLEFTLTLKIRRDPHIISQFKALAPPPPPPAPTQKGVFGFFSSPKKWKGPSAAAAQPTQPLVENFARYLKGDGTLARAFISFKDIAPRCDSKIFETSFPLIGQRIEAGSKFSTLQVGEIVLQVFRLPPLPGIPADQLPQSLEECHRGLRHTNWHKVTYFEGTLTQNGGDCHTWRRRRFRVIGASLVAFNDVTKKAIATIDLKQAVAVEDDQDEGILSPASAITARSNRYADDGLVERSFRLVFPQDHEIVFFADTDEEKAKWLEVFRALVGHIPPHPLWGEMLWHYHEEQSKRKSNSSLSKPQPPPPAGKGR